MAAKEMISLRVWRADLEAWKAAARREGLDRSSWMNKTLNKATGRPVSGDSASAATGPGGSELRVTKTHPSGAVNTVVDVEAFKSSLSGPVPGEPPSP